MAHESRYIEYQDFCSSLIGARESVGLTQTVVADRLGKPQSFVSKYERGERRLDVLEFVDVMYVLGLNPSDYLSQFLRDRNDVQFSASFRIRVPKKDTKL